MLIVKRFLTVLFGVALLAACSSTPRDSQEGMKLHTERDQQDGARAGMTGFESDQMMGEGPKAGTEADFIVNVGQRVFFGFDRHDLSDDARETLQRQAEWLKQHPEKQVIVEGHADERGTREYNLALGERRATAVKNYLGALGIDSSRLSTVSYGKERPAVLGSNEAAWARNRRAVTTLK